MNIDFTYVIISVNTTNKTMEVSYSAADYPTITKEVRLPWEKEDLDIVVRDNAPTGVWWTHNLPVQDVVVGTTNVLNSQYQPVMAELADTDVQVVKTKQIAAIAQSRYLYEVSGVSVNGTFFKTDRESQASITSAFISLSQGLLTTIDWKTVNGVWVSLGLQQVTDIYNAVVTKVQLGFTTEKRLVEAINEVDAAQDNAIALIESIVWPQ